MRARRMAANIEAVRVGAEARSIAVDPADRPADLIGHWEQIATDILHPSEIRHDVMRAGAHEHLRRRCIMLCQSALPRTAMDEDKNRCVRARRAEHVELLDRSRAVGMPLGFADAGASTCAVALAPLPDLLDIRLIHALVIGGVE